MTSDQEAFPQQLKEAQAKFNAVKREMSKVIVGQHALINRLLIGLIVDGHLLLEGVPGVAKTLAANTLARIVNCGFKRIQFTPDLLPADLIGTSIYNPKEGAFFIKKGPIFTNILLADEINRAPAKVQSALLEIMQEKQVTIAGETFAAPQPFLVLATQNPIEQEGTYPLSEAQTDRFMMKIKIDYPTPEEEKEILRKMGTLGPLPQVTPLLSVDDLAAAKQLVNQVYVDEQVEDYLLNIVLATRHPENFNVDIVGLLEYGASPRATISLKNAAKAQAFLDGRPFVTPQDVKDLAHDIMRHRLRPSYEAEAEDLTTDDLIQRVLDTLPVP